MPSTLAAVGEAGSSSGSRCSCWVALSYGYYSIKGSGIDAHPSDGLPGPPGSAGPSDVSKGRGSEGDTEDGGTGGTFSTHGTG
jgi:hypothetical protein